MEADSQSAGAYIEYARLEPDKTKARAALEKAVKVNPKLAEPHVLMAERETDLDRKIVRSQGGRKLDARNAASWQALAEAYLAEHNYGDAAKAWRAAEQAATTDADRDRYRQARVASNSSAWITRPPSAAARKRRSSARSKS